MLTKKELEKKTKAELIDYIKGIQGSLTKAGESLNIMQKDMINMVEAKDKHLSESIHATNKLKKQQEVIDKQTDLIIRLVERVV